MADLKERFEELNVKMDTLMNDCVAAAGIGSFMNMETDELKLIQDCFKLMDEFMAWYSDAAGELDRLKSIESKIDILLEERKK